MLTHRSDVLIGSPVDFWAELEEGVVVVGSPVVVVGMVNHLFHSVLFSDQKKG